MPGPITAGGTFDGSNVLWSDLTVPAHSSIQVSFGVTVTCVSSGTLIVNNAYTVTASDWPTPTTGLPVTVTATAAGVSADFTYGPTPVLVNRAVSFNNLSHNATGYEWAFGNGVVSTLANPSYAYTGTGIYTAVLTASNLCGYDAVSHSLTVGNYAVALVPDASTPSGDPGQVVTYTLHLTNTGTLSDVYSLTRGSTPWTTSFSTTTVHT